MFCIIFLMALSLSIYASEEPEPKISPRDQKEIELFIEHANFEELVNKILPHGQLPLPINESHVRCAGNHYALKAAAYEHQKPDYIQSGRLLMRASAIVNFLSLEHASQRFQKNHLQYPKA